MEVELKLPLDSTFLSQVIYEGVLYLIFNAPSSGAFNENSVSLHEGSLCNAFARMDEKAIERISIEFAMNDWKYFFKDFFDKIRLKEKLEKTHYEGLLKKEKSEKGKKAKAPFRYGELLKLLKNMCENAFLTERFSISLQKTGDRKGEYVALGKDVDNGGKRYVIAPQLFKVDRYTGISSGEMPLTSEEVRLKALPEAILIGLLGIYSSYITTVRQQKNVYHYFVFFSPSEVMDILGRKSKENTEHRTPPSDEVMNISASGDRVSLENIYPIKNHLRDLLSKTLRSSALSEVMMLEVMLSSKIRADLSKANLDKVDFMIFKISPEGRRTYKIYETVPLTVYASPFFYEKLARSVKEPERICDVLQKAISPGKPIMEALASFNSENKFDEADKVLNGVLSLYRFITLADFQYLTQFLRCMREACDVLRGKKDKKAARRLREYEKIQGRLSHLLKIKRSYLRGEVG